MNIPVVTNRLRPVLTALFVIFGLMTVNSVYLVAITIVEWLSGDILQDQFYLLMFLSHLALGILLALPLIAFGFLHFRRAREHKNRYAKRAGITLFLTAIILVVSGLLLTRFPFFEINQASIRRISYWLHVIAPVIVIWLFILHRMAGRKIKWQQGVIWLFFTIVVSTILITLRLSSLNQHNNSENISFEPSLTKLEGAQYLPSKHFMMDDYCAQCHQDIAKQSASSMHKLSSFNNPAYRASIDEARQVFLERDGNVEASRFCAGCHDQVPLLSGEFDDPHFNTASSTKSSASAGITCLGCHSITSIDSVRGNGDYTISAPKHYPFTYSDNKFLSAINRQLIKAKPAFHKKTLLKPFHASAEFCSTCHKVHIPQSLNQYRWLRGQNHYDSFFQSGISGHRVDSFYYPKIAKKNCASCHMPLTPSTDPAATHQTSNSLPDGSSKPVIHNHKFLAANTAIAPLLGMDNLGLKERQEFLKRSARVDLFALREDRSGDASLPTTLQPESPTLEAGKSYILSVVVRTRDIGHHLTQGTSDSNELWLELTASSNGKIFAKSGARKSDGSVDSWAYFLNSYILDKNGQKIDRRNVQDIFVALYDHQIPPGSASIVRYKISIPENISTPVTINAKLNYRKFNTDFLRFIQNEKFVKNTLPITTITEDTVIFPTDFTHSSKIPLWERWNDFGIGLLRNSSAGYSKGDLRLAEEAFKQVEKLNPAYGSLNLARLYFKEGRLEEASQQLQKATLANAYPWTIIWYEAQISHQRGQLKLAERQLKSLLNTEFNHAKERGFDFSKDIRAINLLGRVYYDLALQRRINKDKFTHYLQQAKYFFNQTLKIEPENQSAHFNLSRTYSHLKNPEKSQYHYQLHERYRADDQAVEVAVSKHRQNNPAADHAAEPGAIYSMK